MKRAMLLGLGLCLLAGAFGCANGGKFAGTGNSDGGGGTGGSGGQTTMSTGGETTTTTTTTTTPTPTCDESPCKLVTPQCGCTDGEMCAINNMGDKTCHAAGETLIDQECVGLYSCAPGSLCVLVSSSKSICTSYCDDDMQCDGGLCLIELNDPGSPGQVLQGVTLCSDDCDPVTGAGCPVGLSLGCQLGVEQDGLMRVFTICSGTGAGTQGMACVDNEDCQPGSACFTLSDMTHQCLKYCKVNSPSCPVGTGCAGFDPPILYKGTEYGACL